MQPPYSNSDQQLGESIPEFYFSFRTNPYIEQDEREAVDKSNILRGDRLRHAKPSTSNKYNEGPDETDLPSME